MGGRDNIDAGYILIISQVLDGRTKTRSKRERKSRTDHT